MLEVLSALLFMGGGGGGGFVAREGGGGGACFFPIGKDILSVLELPSLDAALP